MLQFMGSQKVGCDLVTEQQLLGYNSFQSASPRYFLKTVHLITLPCALLMWIMSSISSNLWCLIYSTHQPYCLEKNFKLDFDFKHFTHIISFFTGKLQKSISQWLRLGIGKVMSIHKDFSRNLCYIGQGFSGLCRDTGNTIWPALREISRRLE